MKSWGVSAKGYKEILSITVGINKTSKFWLGMFIDLKKISSNFKAVYNTPNETATLSELEVMKKMGGRKYPYTISNWENVSSFFQFSDDIHRIMYTTNLIEALNQQYRKVAKTKHAFLIDTALAKMLHLSNKNIVKKWTQRCRN